MESERLLMLSSFAKACLKYEMNQRKEKSDHNNTISNDDNENEQTPSCCQF